MGVRRTKRRLGVGLELSVAIAVDPHCVGPLASRSRASFAFRRAAESEDDGLVGKLVRDSARARKLPREQRRNLGDAGGHTFRVPAVAKRCFHPRADRLPRRVVRLGLPIGLPATVAGALLTRWIPGGPLVLVTDVHGLQRLRFFA